MGDSGNRFVIEENEVTFIDIEELEKEGTLKKYSTFEVNDRKTKGNGEE